MPPTPLMGVPRDSSTHHRLGQTLSWHHQLGTLLGHSTDQDQHMGTAASLWGGSDRARAISSIT